MLVMLAARLTAQLLAGRRARDPAAVVERILAVQAQEPRGARLAIRARTIAVRGPVLGREHAYVLVSDWLGAARPVERGRALAELARRYLAGHGPAGDRDLAKWSGLPLHDARAGLAAIGRELVERANGAVDL